MSSDIPVKVPRIARGPRKPRIAPYAAGLALLGTAVFASLASNRQAGEDRSLGLPLLRKTQSTATAPVEPAPNSLPIANAPFQTVPGAAPMPGMPAMPGMAPNAPPTGPLAITPLTIAGPRGGAMMDHTLHGNAAGPIAGMAMPMPSGNPLVRSTNGTSPALIVDLAQAGGGVTTIGLPTAVMSDSGTTTSKTTTTSANDPTGAAIAAAGGNAAQTTAGDASTRDLSSDERFAARAGARDASATMAQRMRNQSRLVAQGTIIGATMETALNSDLPGFARALVSRDVLSFDGSQVLIPAGSRVIGEYKSGVAQGASRIFIVWNRLIRPDGVTVNLGSPAIDDLGRGGLGGTVNRHFLQRFGGAILMSVLTGGVNALTQSVARSSTIVVSSTSEATSLANQAARGNDIAPTIKTRNGASVRIFVARDLDFSGV